MSNQALLQQNPAFLLRELARARERAVQLEACLGRAEEEREKWQRIAEEYKAMVASQRIAKEYKAIGSSPDVGDAASCTRHPLTIEELREGTGMELCKDAL
ncbi:uncharacterized protein [Elaeis guineensis]